MSRTKMKTCICCQTNTFRDEKHRKYCSNCGRYIHDRVDARIQVIGESLRRIDNRIKEI